MSEQTTKKLRDWTISWEEALEREMEYRKRMKNKLPQHSVDSVVSPSGSKPQEQLQEANTIGLKRKAASESFPQPGRKLFEHQMVPPQLIKGQLNPSQRTFVRKLPSQQQEAQTRKLPSPQFQNRKHPPQQSTYYKPPLRILQYRQTTSYCPQVQIVRPLQGESLNQSNPLKLEVVHWCSLCKVKCMTSLHLEQHRQGRKHKGSLEKVWGVKKINGNKEIWCPECNVKCLNEFSWNQHRIGQKHLLCIAKKAIEASNGAGPVIQPGKVGCVQKPQRTGCTDKEEIAKANLRIPGNKIISPAIQNQKPRTSNWPNWML